MDGDFFGLRVRACDEEALGEGDAQIPHGEEILLLLEKSDRVLCKGVAARYAFMKPWRLHFPVKAMSRLLAVSRSGFYAWLKRKPSRRRQEDERLKVAIPAAHRRTRET